MKTTRFQAGIFLALLISLLLILDCYISLAAEEEITDYQNILQESENSASDSYQDLRGASPTRFWVTSTDTNGLPATAVIEAFKAQIGGSNNPTYIYQIYLPGNAVLENCFLSWDGSATVTIDGITYESGELPVPQKLDEETTYTFQSGEMTAAYTFVTYQGSKDVQPVFMIIDETYMEEGESIPHTIAAMDADEEHDAYCVGEIYINGVHYGMPKITGRGNATWGLTEDKKPYNVTLGAKTTLGLDTPETKKWSFLAEACDHSLLCNRSGFYLAKQMGIAQDTMSADVWMNGEYQGCYTITPKTDSFVTKNGFMIEQDNYQEKPVANGGDPQFALVGLDSHVYGWSSVYNLITVKKMGDDLLTIDGVVDESPENLEAVANNKLKPWLQETLDAILAEDGMNPSTGKSYKDYIDIESFAKMYLMQEYVKSFDICAGSLFYYREGMNDDDKLMAGPLWDLDNGLGSTCMNNELGPQRDLRSAQGDFIVNIEEYKTSIYKNLGKHEDFMDEVKRQYNIYKSAFDSLPDDVQTLIEEIGPSARMNHIKVIDLTDTYANNHNYSENTTLGSGPYVQYYLATPDSKRDWDIYAANLKTYIRVRSLWFEDNYYDPTCICEHEYEEETTPPTCTEKGCIEKKCVKCGKKVTESIPATGHEIVHHEKVDATFESEGSSEYWECERCGKYYSDDQGQNEIAEYSWVIPKLVPINGWVKNPAGVWHYYTDGVAATGWKQIGGKWYLFNREGEMLTGWQKVDNTWYYMNSSGAMVTGWQKIGGVWYYFTGSGAMVTGWQKVGSTWYYMNSSGAMLTGWQKINGTWYFFKSGGVMAANEWCDGYWLNADGSWTYQPRGSWKKNDTGWWFGDTSGWYAKSTTQKIDDENYTFNAAGYWVK